MIAGRWEERQIERFGAGGISAAKARMGEVWTASGGFPCALVYQGRVARGEDAILVECLGAGGGEIEVYAQRFRPRRGLLRGFKLIGEVTRVGSAELTLVAPASRETDVASASPGVGSDQGPDGQGSISPRRIA